jgi:hypothetical protein
VPNLEFGLASTLMVAFVLALALTLVLGLVLTLGSDLAPTLALG